jgi:dihydroorotate dehydrogenase (NAD+) catalytic subunit
MTHPALELKQPLMNAAGFLGFAPEPRGPVPLEKLGAFVTNPISRRARRPARQRRAETTSGAAFLHGGLPNPGLSAAIRKYAARWARAPLPVIVHLLAESPDEAGGMVQRLEGLDNVLAVELGLLETLDERLAAEIVAAAQGELPVIARLSLAAQSVGAAVVAAGASAVSLGPLPGAIRPLGAADRDGQPVRGRLYGPGVFPAALAAVQSLAGQGLPVIGAGGVYEPEQAEAMLAAGALAVQVDAALWKGVFGNW